MPSSGAAADRLGLALSGGGFRASFYHVGTLARLSDAGVLPRVEVVSSVSGGSITAAVYGLHLRRLLGEGRADAHAEAVRATWTTLRSGVRRNLRGMLFANVWHTLRLLGPRFSRSDRLGILYERHLLRPAAGATGGPGRLGMPDLAAGPGQPEFLLNATTLNTGHNWRFSATTMGEPPRDGSWVMVDKNARLCPPPSYALTRWGAAGFPLGAAVAASTAVPGLFAPMPVSGLYPGMRLQLVDGGVHDNLGVEGLADVGCTCMVVSGAGGQMGDLPRASADVLSVLSRSASIMRDRVREESLDGLVGSDGVLFIHLRSGVEVEAVPFLDAEGTPHDCTAPAEPRPASDPEHKERLASIRTDLDAFSDAEAAGLADDAFRSLRYAIEDGGPSWGTAGPGGDWPFTTFREARAGAGGRIDRVLRNARRRWMKPLWNAGPLDGLVVVALLLAGLALAVAPTALAAWVLVAWTGGAVWWWLGGAALLALALEALWRRPGGVGAWLRRWWWLMVPHRIVPALLFALGAAAFTWTYVPATTALYLRRGRL